MKIPQHVHQFNGVRALIVVSGKQDAVLLECSNGNFEKLDSVELDHSQFFNDGPFYKARSQGGMTRSGPVREVQDQKIVMDFIKELKTHLKKVRSELYDEVYVIAPSKSKNEVVKAMPDALQRKVKEVQQGNFYRMSPSEIIRKIRESAVEAPTPRGEEAQHIYETANQAHSVMKTRF